MLGACSSGITAGTGLRRLSGSEIWKDISPYTSIRLTRVLRRAERFRLITKDDDGKLRERKYSFDGDRVHLIGTEDYHPGERPEPPRAGRD